MAITSDLDDNDDDGDDDLEAALVEYEEEQQQMKQTVALQQVEVSAEAVKQFPLSELPPSPPKPYKAVATDEEELVNAMKDTKL